MASLPPRRLGPVRGRHDDSMDSPMVRAAVQRTGADTLDTPVSDRRFSAASPGHSHRSPALRSPPCGGRRRRTAPWCRSR